MVVVGKPTHLVSEVLIVCREETEVFLLYDFTGEARKLRALRTAGPQMGGEGGGHGSLTAGELSLLENGGALKHPAGLDGFMGASGCTVGQLMPTPQGRADGPPGSAKEAPGFSFPLLEVAFISWGQGCQKETLGVKHLPSTTTTLPRHPRASNTDQKAPPLGMNLSCPIISAAISETPFH